MPPNDDGPKRRHLFAGSEEEGVGPGDGDGRGLSKKNRMKTKKTRTNDPPQTEHGNKPSKKGARRPGGRGGGGGSSSSSAGRREVGRRSDRQSGHEGGGGGKGGGVNINTGEDREGRSRSRPRGGGGGRRRSLDSGGGRGRSSRDGSDGGRGRGRGRPRPGGRGRGVGGGRGRGREQVSAAVDDDDVHRRPGVAVAGRKRRRGGNSSGDSVPPSISSHSSPMGGALSHAPSSSPHHILSWHRPRSHVPLEAEESLLPSLLRWNASERGMFRSQPSWRLTKVQQSCKRVGVELIQALSLRRTHMQHLNPSVSMPRLGLGASDMVRGAAALFEEAVEAHLVESGVPFASEHDQRRESSGPMAPTPDFLFEEPTRLRLDGKMDRGAAQPPPSTSTVVRWLEAKMFYGASSVPDGTSNAVGQIVPKMRKYVDLFGPGAIVFAFGCGERLAQRLAEMGVVALDASPLDLSSMEQHQRTWCADDQGRILP